MQNRKLVTIHRSTTYAGSRIAAIKKRALQLKFSRIAPLLNGKILIKFITYNFLPVNTFQIGPVVHPIRISLVAAFLALVLMYISIRSFFVVKVIITRLLPNIIQYIYIYIGKFSL